MEIMNMFKDKARSNKKTIVLPEGSEPRIYKAAEKIVEQELANLILLGEENNILEKNPVNLTLSYQGGQFIIAGIPNKGWDESIENGLIMLRKM